MNLSPANIQLIVAFFSPLVVAVAKQARWPNSVNGFLAILTYICFGVLGVATSGQPLDLQNIVPTVATFTAIGTVAYTAFWKNTGLEAAITATTLIATPSTTVPPNAINRGS